MKSKLFVSLSVALLIGATSCSDEVVVRNQQGGDLDSPMELTFSATGDEMVLTGNTSTRSLVREGKSVLWIANDRISVFAGEGTEYNYPFITKDGGVVTNYKGTVSHTPEKYYYALYPYNSSASLSGRTFTTVLYSHQYLEPHSYASGMNLSVSRSENGSGQDLAFINSAAYLRVMIPSDYQGEQINSIRLHGNNNEKIAGDVEIEVIPSNPSAVVIPNDNAAETIYLERINEGDYVMPGLSYYFVLAPTNMTEGFTLTFVCEDGLYEQVFDAHDFIRNEVYTVSMDADLLTKGEDECGLYTDDGLFIVNSCACLYEWANLAKSDLDLGCYITASFDFDAESYGTWPIIGTEDDPYVGRIIGGGNTISGLTVSTDGRYAGFIGALGAEGSIENLNFTNPTITSSYAGKSDDATDDGFVGTVVGLLNHEQTNNHTGGSIKNCHVVNPTINGGENVGGIVGRSYGRGDAVSNCTVSGGQLTGRMFVGGIIGNAEGVIENSHVLNSTKIMYDNTQTEARVGGIVGTNNTGELVACTAKAEVYGESDEDRYDARYAGGIAGANNGTMIGCAFSGKVTGDYSGALAGESYGDMYGCYAQGATAAALIYKVKRNLNNASDVTVPTFSACYWVEGNTIFGSGNENATVQNCNSVSAISQVTATMNNALKAVENNNQYEYEYGTGYQYSTNAGTDAENFPVKATIPQQL